MNTESVSSRIKLSALFSLALSSCCVSTLSLAQADYSLVNVRDTVHIVNCGSCHLPYSPALLPMQSWLGIMTGLDHHFGEVVELSEDNLNHILAYLEIYALQQGQQSVMGQLAKGLPENPPLRITELPAFVELHSTAEELLGVDRLERTSFSSCESCHRAAASHIFDKALLQVGTGDGPLSDYK
ncbi:MAG: hypothetical protein VB977_14015 [Pseudohongiellaceae bacterium]